MRKFHRFAAAVSLATLAGSLGCSAGSSFTNPLSFGKSKNDSALAAAPPFDRSYDELASVQRDRKLATSGGDVEPGAMTKLSRSMTDNSVTQGVKTAWTKTAASTGALFTTRKGPEANATSLYSGTGEIDADFCVAFAKNEVSKKNMAKAIEHYEAALKLEPNHKGALLGIAHIYDSQNNLNKAMTYYRRAVKAHPKDAAAHNDLGLCYARQNKLHEAAQSLERAVQLAPDKPLYRNNIATVLVEMGHPDAALAHLTEAHGEATAHYNVGCLLYGRGDKEGALEHFAMAYEKDRTMASAYEWTVAVQNELLGTNAAVAQSAPAEQPAATATDDRLAAQTASRGAPSLTPSWASDADHSSLPAAAPAPDVQNGYYPVEPDPSAMSPSGGDSTYRLPPIDTAYRAPSRY